jgi:hypothetical protein
MSTEKETPRQDSRGTRGRIPPRGSWRHDCSMLRSIPRTPSDAHRIPPASIVPCAPGPLDRDSSERPRERSALGSAPARDGRPPAAPTGSIRWIPPGELRSEIPTSRLLWTSRNPRGDGSTRLQLPRSIRQVPPRCPPGRSAPELPPFPKRQNRAPPARRDAARLPAGRTNAPIPRRSRGFGRAHQTRRSEAVRNLPLAPRNRLHPHAPPSPSRRSNSQKKGRSDATTENPNPWGPTYKTMAASASPPCNLGAKHRIHPRHRHPGGGFPIGAWHGTPTDLQWLSWRLRCRWCIVACVF